MNWICVVPASYLNWSCQGEWEPDLVLFSREKPLWSDCSVKCWLHLCAPGLADFCKGKADKIWHVPSFSTGLSCLSPGSGLPYFACLLLSPPGHLSSLLLLALLVFSSHRYLPLGFITLPSFSPSQLYSNTSSVSEHVCAYLLHTIQESGFLCTTPSSVLVLAFGGLTASLPGVPVLSCFPGHSPLLHSGAGGEDAEQLCCFFLILLEIVLSSFCLLVKTLFWPI